MRKIFELSWPVMLGVVLQNLLGTVDLYFVGKLGTTELAAVSLINSLLIVIFMLSTLVSAGAIASVSRAYGEGDIGKIQQLTGKSYFLSMVLGISVSFITVIGAYPLITNLYKADTATLTAAYTFALVSFAGTFIVFMNSTLKTIIQATGDTKAPLYIFGLCNIVNMILDPILMFVLGLGIQGAAWATLLANLIGCILLNRLILIKFYNNKMKEMLKYFIFKWKSIKPILTVGGWACIQSIARPLTGIFMTSLVLQVGGVKATAAFGAGGQVLNYTFIFLSGLAMAISILVGQSLGEKKVGKCNKIIHEGLKLALINMAIFAIPYLIFPRQIISIVTREPEVINIGVEYLKIVYIGVIAVVFPDILGAAFKGAGDTYPPMIASILANVVFKLPCAYILAVLFKVGTRGIWIAIALSIIVEGVMMIRYFKQGTWKEKKI